MNIEKADCIGFAAPLATSGIELRRTGRVGVISDSDLSFILLSEESDDRCVIVPKHANLFLVALAPNSFTSEKISFSDLETGRLVDVFGAFDANGCLVARDILVFRSQQRARAFCAKHNEHKHHRSPFSDEKAERERLVAVTV